MSAILDPTMLLSSLVAAKLIPSPLIPENFKPTVHLSVTFGHSQVTAGNLFRASDCKVAPAVSFTAEENTRENPTYTFMLVDPDAPTPDDPKFSYWRHWIVTSIPGPDSPSEAAVESGKTLTAYLAPGPKDESKPHRYMFLLYREPKELRELTKDDVGGEEFVQRRSFGAKEFTQKHGLELVGVNWMLGAGDGWIDQRSEL